MADQVPGTAELLRAWDAARPRSKQESLGMSDLGGCRRKAGYVLAGQEREATRGHMAAIIGTAIHDAAAAAARAVIPGARADDFAVEFGGVTGHPDLYVPPVLRDLKTVARESVLDSYAVKGPPLRHRWQAHTYAAAIILGGIGPVSTVEIEYLTRDMGKTWRWSEPFSPGLVAQAMDWLAAVRDTPVEALSRDYRPEGEVCGSCPFYAACWEGHAVAGRSPRSALYADDPDAAKWAAQLEEAKAAKADAEERYADAKGALDWLRPNTSGTCDVTVPGLPAGEAIRFTVARGRVSLDKNRVTADYARAGAEPPTVQGEPSVRISIVKAKPAEGDPHE